MDQEIELAEPNFTPLPPEEMAQAVSLLAALIRAVSARRPNSMSAPRRKFASEDLADRSPPARRDRGKAAPAKGAGGEA